MTSIPQDARSVAALHRMRDGKGAVRMEDLYDTDIDDLWSALTNPRRLARWIADVDGDLRLNGQFYARFTSSTEGPGRIDVCRAPHHLVVTMLPGTPDQTVIEATLLPEQGRTRLVIEHRGFRLEDLAAIGAGWQVHAEDLTAHVDARPTGDWGARWAALTPAYQDLAGGLL
jgi:uncharacterized protein YndB with AHSA1/START domain